MKSIVIRTLTRNLPALGLLLSLVACEQVIDVPEPEHTPSLAVRYTLGTTPADSAWDYHQGYRQLYVSASRRLFDTRPLRGVRDATVQLFDAGGTLVEEFQPAPDYGNSWGGDTMGYYRPTRNFVGQPGGTYRLRVEAPGYATVESRLTLPGAPVMITGATYAPKAGNWPGDRRGKLSVTIQDDPSTTDYYVATARFLDPQGQPTQFGRVQRDDEDNDGDTDFQAGRFTLSEPVGTGDLYPFADSDVSGQAFTLNADVAVYSYDPATGNPLPGQIEVTVSRVTADTYNFWLSRRRYLDTQNNPFAEPAPLRSNITGGFGIFGGATDAAVRVTVD